MGASTDLTPKQEAFIRFYLETGVAAEAYRKAYNAKAMSDNAIYVEASKLLDNPKIAVKVEQLTTRKLKRSQILVERIEQEYARLAFVDLRKAYDDEGNLKPIKELDDDTAAAVAGIDVESRTLKVSGTDTAVVTRTKKLKLYDKKGALDSLAKIMGMATDRVEVTGKDGAPLQEMSMLETARRLAFILAQGAAEADKQK